MSMTNIDQLQIKEWLDSIDSVIENDSIDTAKELLQIVGRHLKNKTGDDVFTAKINTDYLNTIPHTEQIPYPGDKEIEAKLSSLIRWNATAMVLKANKISSELGGHIASYASSSSLYEVGFNHFWKSPSDNSMGDMVFFQGHSSPGVYARSFIEGRLDESTLLKFRQEANGDGLSSYPHPWLMPTYWQFPTVSMGLGPLMAIYQARFMKYLSDRKLINDLGRKVWCFIGDGETSEPETLGNIHIASRDNLDNLIFVINCNLQRLDGPVHGNGKIIQELEGVFIGANWKVIKIIWGSGWDALLEKDKSGKLAKLMMECIDGEYQTYRSKDGAYIRQHFFGKYSETLNLVSNMSDVDIWHLTRGGHDLDKIYNAYYQAVHHNDGKPVVILAKTIKGYGMEGQGQSQNIAHQQKKLSTDTLKKICAKFNINLTHEQIEDLPFLKPIEGSAEYNYLHERREKLGGYYPKRITNNTTISIPNLDTFDSLLKTSGDRELSTTMVFVRILNLLLKDKNFGKYIVPIVPDESRTFGMEGMFRQYGIWSHLGQKYTPEDSSQLMFYREDIKGQIFQEGINEAGAMSTWIAAATSYANHNITMIPFYIYYSMFGFQRIGDLAWASGDMRARGFLIGGTAGRTTLNGEGLQHEDGHSHIQASLIPNCDTYDPTFSYELVLIIQNGLKEMYVENKDKFYYITIMNENYTHPDMPIGIEADLIKGCYLYKIYGNIDNQIKINLMGSGTIFREVIKAAELLSSKYGVTVYAYSAVSYNKLYRNAIEVERYNRHQIEVDNYQKPFITSLLEQSEAKITVSATDYIRNYANQITPSVPNHHIVLGTDGFGRSDFRSALRRFFEVDVAYITLTSLHGLYQIGLIDKNIFSSAIIDLNIDINKQNPWDC